MGPKPLATTSSGAAKYCGGTTACYSGRVTSVATAPDNSFFKNPNYWLIGTAQGGVWATRNAGQAWVARTDAQASLATGAVSFAPNKPFIIYAGTGEANFVSDSYAGQGLLKSTSNGANWTQLGTHYFSGASFSHLIVNPTNENNLVMTTTQGVAGRLGTPLPKPPVTGVYVTSNGGSTFALGQCATCTGGTLTGEATGLAVSSSNFNNQYAAIGDIFGTAGNGLYRSTDGGVTWSHVAGPWDSLAAGIGRVALALAPADQNTLYVSIQDAFNGIGTDGGLLGLWMTSDAWDTQPVWNSIDVTATDDGSGTHGYCGWSVIFHEAEDLCWYDNVLAVDPSNSSILYAGGIPLWMYNPANTPAWTEISRTTSTTGIPENQHALAFAESTLIVGNDSGAWSTANLGAAWTDLNTTQTTTQYYNGALYATPATPPAPPTVHLVLGGAQASNVNLSTGKGLRWTPLLPIAGTGQTGSTDGSAVAISPTNPSKHWVISTAYLNVMQTTDGGVTFNPASPPETTGALFNAPLKECAQNEKVVLAGSQSLWLSTNMFSSAPIWASKGPAGKTFPSGISALAFGPSTSSCNIFAFGSAAADMYVTVNGGLNWTTLHNTPLPGRPVTGLAFGATNPNILFMTFGGFDDVNPGHVFMTSNALPPKNCGQSCPPPTWTNVTPPGLNLPVNAIVIDPLTQNVYIGTDMGIWRSTDSGTTWAQMGEATAGLPNVAIFDLQANGGRVAAFSHGRGAFLLQSYDLNGDGVIDCSDYAIVQKAYGAICGETSYNPLADLNNDCLVDIRDVTLMAQNLASGTTCQVPK